MAFHNGISPNQLTTTNKYASTGTNTRVVSFEYNELVHPASTDLVHIRQFFATMAEGDILHCAGISTDLAASSVYELFYWPMGASAGIELDDNFPSGTAINRTHHYNWSAPADLVLYFQMDTYNNRSFTNGLRGTAWISRPT